MFSRSLTYVNGGWERLKGAPVFATVTSPRYKRAAARNAVLHRMCADERHAILTFVNETTRATDSLQSGSENR
jgi:hypothetical protein